MREHPFNFENMNNTIFKKKIAATAKPMVVDFWAPWCAPCRMTKPILDKLALEYKDRVDFLPINADESREILEEYHITGIPTVMAFRNGELATRITGARDESGYRALFSALASGEQVNIPMRAFDRLLRLGAGFVVIIIGIVTTTWWLSVLGGVIAFLGIYDRCPIWAAITRLFRRKKTA